MAIYRLHRSQRSVCKMSLLNVKSGFLAATCIVLMTFLISSVALADTQMDLTPDKQNTIRQNCTSAQITLQLLQKRDAVSRINRGRSYDQLFRQISALNSRLFTNKVSVPDLVSLTDDMQTNLDHFRMDYDHYYDDLSGAIKSDCKTKPTDFYQQIVKAKGDRATVAADIVLIDELLGKYRTALVHYQPTLQTTGANQ